MIWIDIRKINGYTNQTFRKTEIRTLNEMRVYKKGAVVP